ncbi:hypothetical protein [Megamonas hypermegale]|uniref:hypothetical protein n=1 Tax=Megamonas hypermegale TaxID=158847 RepID=UPI001956CF91|nr:hypothetical protein [Megamonas hypermegale]MBM6761146.1 hypothetical protein [Megamonas hypermegale]
MKNYFIIGLISLLILGVIPSTSQAKVSNGFLTNDNNTCQITYPIVQIDNRKIREKINEDILLQAEELKQQVDGSMYTKADMTYYEKYEDDNIISLMFYVNKTRKFSSQSNLSGYTVTYDKHTGEKVPVTRYLTITLEQLQDALNNSRAYAVDGLDNGVNLEVPIPYVSDNYFICHDGSIGLLYQPGDLMPEDAGACKIIVSPETIAEVNEINNPVIK